MEPKTANVPPEPQAITAMYDAFVASLPRLGRLPKEHRFTLGERVVKLQMEVLELLVRARYDRVKLEKLAAANVALELCRMLVRALCDSKAISVGQYEAWILELDGAGRQIGGWLKFARTKAGEARGTDA